MTTGGSGASSIDQDLAKERIFETSRVLANEENLDRLQAELAGGS